MNEVVMQPRLVDAEKATAEALKPNWNWDRAIPAPGHSNVDFETRVTCQFGS